MGEGGGVMPFDLHKLIEAGRVDPMSDDAVGKLDKDACLLVCLEARRNYQQTLDKLTDAGRRQHEKVVAALGKKKAGV